MDFKKTNRFAFTKARIEAIPLPIASDRFVYHDAGWANLILRVSKSSKKFYFYGRIHGRPARLLLGDFPKMTVDQARKAVARISGAKADGKDPAAERSARRTEATLKDLFGHWLERHGKPHKRTWADDKRQFDKYLNKGWHNRKLSAIRVADVAAWHSKVAADVAARYAKKDEKDKKNKNVLRNGHYQANRCKALLSTLFNKAFEVGFNGDNPCKKVPNFPEKSRERFLLPDEMKAFFVALHQEDELWRDFFLICLFTGSRRGNVASMRWAEIELRIPDVGVKAKEPVNPWSNVERAIGVWHIPSEKTKNKQPGVVALVHPALIVLKERRDRSKGSEWVFPSARGTGHITDPKAAWTRVLTRSGIKKPAYP